MSRRPLILALGAAGLALGLLPVVLPTPPRLVWNATASAPRGLYVVAPIGALKVGQTLAIQPPAPIAAWLADRGAAPLGVLLIKRVAGLAPTTACWRGDVLTLDGRPAARLRGADRLGRSLPRPTGCHVLAADEVLLLNPTPDSLDGRYFGPLSRRAVVGEARLLWCWAPAPMRSDPAPHPAPLFDRTPDDRAFVPTASRAACRGRGRPGRPPGRRERALPWTAATPRARSWRCGTLLMSVLWALAAAPALAAEAPIAAHTRDALIAEAGARFALPVAWIAAVMRVESGGDPRAVSPGAGAIGLMQLMPQTYAELRQRHGLGADPFQPRDNILAGAAYLREMLDRFGAPGFLAAYNAGPRRYAEHLRTGRPLPLETRRYLALLAPAISGSAPGHAAPTAAAPPSVFVPQGATGALNEDLFIALSRPAVTP